MENKSKSWVKDLLVAFAGTTLSIVLTFGTSAFIDYVKRNKDRRMTALMVLSNIESSVRSLEESDGIDHIFEHPENYAGNSLSEEEVMAFTGERLQAR